MAERFNLTAQIQLQAPKNTAQVVGQIRNQLKGINANIQVKANSAGVAKLNKELQGVGKAGDASAKSIGRMNTTLAQAARRFSVITVATGSFLALARAMKNSAGRAVEFERELVKISQVTGKSVSQLKGLSDEVTRLSTSLGASSKDLLSVSRTLAQAGFSAQKTKQALEVLAQTTLAATFDNIQDTTEGAIAVLRQFSAEARASGGEIKFLTATMDAINSVSKSFAVESGDLITAVRRVGGVFASAGGSVNELIALFTSVRATTRESAETIATGLRTIFTRIQRTDTVDQLKQLGIELRNSQGQFVGAFEAVRRLSAGLSSLDPSDFRFSEIVESLGGFRQVGKVIPLIQQFTIAQNALNVAQGASGSVARDAETAQQSLGVQIAKVREDFEALMREFADTSTFRSIVNGALELAKALLQIARALEPLLPMLASLAALKIGKALAPGVGALLGGGLTGRNQGGKIHGFARGGFVPGSGNRDTVPAMLQPGEFVIKKSSASKLGASTLEAMNNNRFKGGIRVGKRMGRKKDPYEHTHLTTGRQGSLIKSKGKFAGMQLAVKTLDNFVLSIPRGINQALRGRKAGNVSGEKLYTAIAATPASTLFRAQISGTGRAGYGDISKFPEAQQEMAAKAEVFKSSVLGSINKQGVYNHDADLAPLANAIRANASPQLANALQSVNEVVAKRAEQGNPVAQQLIAGAGKSKRSQRILRVTGQDRLQYASGGQVDTVPALLTPGEFVINKSSAQSIGYSNLSKMNQTGVKRFAAGGRVGGVQRFANGGGVGPGGGELFGQGLDLGPSREIIEREARIFGDYLLKTGESFADTERATDVLRRELQEGASVVDAEQKAIKSLEKEHKKRAAASRKAVTSTEAVVKSSKNLSTAQQTAAKKTQQIQQQIRGDKTGAERSFIGGATPPRLRAATSPPPRSRGRSAGPPPLPVGTPPPLPVGTPPPLPRGGGSAPSLDKVDKSAKSAAQALNGTSEASKRTTSSLDNTAKSNVSFGQQIARSAEAAQNFVFLGSAVAAVTSQMSGLDDQTKQVINETAGFVTALVGIVGTMTQLATSLSSTRATSTVADAVGDAVQDNVCCDDSGGGFDVDGGGKGKGKGKGPRKVTSLKKAPKASLLKRATSKLPKGAGKAISGLGKAAKFVGRNFGSVATAALATVTSLKAYNTNLRLGAEAVAKKNKADIEGLRTGESKATASSLEKGLLKEIESRERQDSVSMAEQIAIVGGSALAGAAGGAAVGSAIGGIGGTAVPVPVVGTVTGAGVGGLIGGAAGGSAGVTTGMVAVRALEEKRIAASAKAREDEIARVKTTISNLVNLEKSFKTFEDDIANIDLGNLSPKEALQKNLEVVGEAQQMGAAGQINTADRDLQGLLFRVEQLAPGAMAGQEATGENIRAALKGTQGLFGGGVDNAQIEGIVGQFEITEQARKSAIEKTAQISEQAAKNFSTALQQADPKATFEELKNGTGLVATAYKQQVQAIKDQIKVVKSEGQERADRVRDQVDKGEASQADVEAVEQETADKLKQLNDAIDQSDKAIQTTANVNKYMREQQEQAARVQQELNEKMRRAAEVMNRFVDMDAALQKYNQSLTNLSAVMSNTQFDFSVPEIKGLENLSSVGDQGRFAGDVRGLAGSDPALQEAATEVIKTAGLIDRARAELSGFKGASIATTVGLNEQGEETDVVDTAKFLKDQLGIEKGDVGDQVFGQIEKILQEASTKADTEIPVDAIAKVLEEGAANSQQLLSARQALENKEIAAYQKYVNAIAAIRDRDIAAAVANVDAETRAADLMAKARGEEVSFADRERSRTRSAQTALGGITDPSGNQVQAGNIDQVLSTRLAAEGRREQIATELQTAKGDDRNKLIAEENKLADVVNRTTSELGRLSDQSGKASEMLSEIEKASRGRKQLAGMATNFAFGSDAARRGTAQNLASTRLAIQSGRAGRGLQGATEEQRAGVASVLDQLSDFEGFGVRGRKADGTVGQLSGREIKAELAAQEVLRTTGDQRAADAIRGEIQKGSKEEQLIKSLDNLAKEIVDATRAQGTRLTPDIQPPPGMQATTTGVGTVAQQEVAAMTDADVLNALKNNKLAEFESRKEVAKASGDTAELRSIYNERQAFKKQTRKDVKDFRSGGFSEERIGAARLALTNQKTNATLATPVRSFQTADPIQQSVSTTAVKSSEGQEMIKALRDVGSVIASALPPAVSNAVGFNKKASPDNISGFKGGGVIGTGDIEQRKNGGQIGNGGGGLMIDPANLTTVLDNFNTRLESVFANVVTQFTGFSERLTMLSETFGNLTMSHTFSGDMTLAFNITNADTIKNAVANAITPKITEIITNELNTRLNKDFQAGP